MEKHRIVLTIRALDIGGAERQFLELVKKINKDNFELLVVTSYQGILDNEISGFKHVCLNKKGKFDILYFFRIIRIFLRFKPNVVYSFMPDMNITMSIIKLLMFNSFKLVWGQFGSEPDYNAYESLRRRIYIIQRRLEFTASAIISDGRQGISFLRKLGYNLKQHEVIWSGTDVLRFKYDKLNRIKFRELFNLQSNDIAIGICSRLDPMKGYFVLAEAAKILCEKFPNVYFFSIGYGNENIISHSKKILGHYSERFVWLGKQDKPEQFMSGWDIYCSTSLYGEGFSNSIIEAMACSLPVIATNIGEASQQVGNTGKILEPGNATVLAETISDWIISGEYLSLGNQARARVEENFSSSLMAANTGKYLTKICAI